MNRAIDDLNILEEFCNQFCKIIEKHTEYIIVSGFVAIASGRTRGTEDIDMIIPKLSINDFENLHNELIKNKFECMQSESYKEIYDYLIKKSSVRYTWKDKFLPEMEVKFAKDKLDDYQLKTKTKLKETNLDIWFSSIEMNIAFKEEYLKSNKDIEDAKHLRKIYKVNEEEVKKIKKMIEKMRP